MNTQPETPASLRALADHYDQLAGGGPRHAAELRARADELEVENELYAREDEWLKKTFAPEQPQPNQEPDHL